MNVTKYNRGKINDIIYGLECIADEITVPCKGCPYSSNQGAFGCRKKCARDAIELIKGQHERKWILASERPPEEDTYVNVFCINLKTKRKFVTIGVFTVYGDSLYPPDYEFLPRAWEVFDDDTGRIEENIEVIAWMPLPEPPEQKWSIETNENNN